MKLYYITAERQNQQFSGKELISIENKQLPLEKTEVLTGEGVIMVCGYLTPHGDAPGFCVLDTGETWNGICCNFSITRS